MEEQEIEKTTVKQVSIKWGLISGVVAIAYFLIISMADMIGNQGASWFGYVPFIILMFLAHKAFKNEGDGFMSYSQGLGIGTLMALVSSIVSGIFTYVYIKFIDTSFFENMQDKMIEQWEEQGLTDAQIDQALEMTSMFSTPELTFVFGIVAAVFFGFIISLIVSAITKNSNQAMEV